MFDVLGVYLVDFGNVRGAEFAGKHYAVVLSSVKINGDSLLVAPMTSKKKGKNVIQNEVSFKYKNLKGAFLL